MTNLEIIKYLALTNPTRLAELLDDIYCTAWNCGSCAGSTGKIMEECEIDDFNEWINQDASKSGFYYDEELEEWSKLMEKDKGQVERLCRNCDNRICQDMHPIMQQEYIRLCLASNRSCFVSQVKEKDNETQGET